MIKNVLCINSIGITFAWSTDAVTSSNLTLSLKINKRWTTTVLGNILYYSTSNSYLKMTMQFMFSVGSNQVHKVWSSGFLKGSSMLFLDLHLDSSCFGLLIFVFFLEDVKRVQVSLKFCQLWIFLRKFIIFISWGSIQHLCS